MSSGPSHVGAAGVVASAATPTHAPLVKSTATLVVREHDVLVISTACQCGNAWCGWTCSVYPEERSSEFGTIYPSTSGWVHQPAPENHP